MRVCKSTGPHVGDAAASECQLKRMGGGERKRENAYSSQLMRSQMGACVRMLLDAACACTLDGSLYSRTAGRGVRTHVQRAEASLHRAELELALGPV
jgi:hypothetical protein